MFEELLGIGASAASGGALGVIGVGLQSIFKWLDHKNERAYELEQRRLDIQELKETKALEIQETEARLRGEAAIASIELAKTETEADAAALQASYEHDKASYGGGFVDQVRGLMRPIITGYYAVLEAIVLGVLIWAAFSIGIKPTATEVWSLVIIIVNSVVFLAGLSVAWWFGSRPLRAHQ